jgi:hypothetical protein
LVGKIGTAERTPVVKAYLRSGTNRPGNTRPELESIERNGKKMTTDERVERLTANLESLRGTVDILAGTVNTLGGTVAAHDDQLEKLLVISEKSAANWENLERQWQAYLNTLPRQ